MRIAVISDVHSNLAALEAVMDAIEGEAVDELWCLGDLVGYGPDPVPCHARVTARADICLAGNHDLVVSGVLPFDVFAHDAAAAARWTIDVLDRETRTALAELVPQGERRGVELYHASIRDPVWEYVLDDGTARACLALQRSNLAMIGHSHVPLVFGMVDGRLVGGAVEGDADLALDAGRFLVNPGSVGQPRDGDPRAAFLLLDLERRHAGWRRVPYDVRRTQAAMRDAGLPLRLAARLSEGH